MTQLGGTNTLKLAGSPALPSGSANGVTRFTTFSSIMSRSRTNTGTVVILVPKNAQCVLDFYCY